MELTSSFSLSDEISHQFLKNKKSDSGILLHNLAVVLRLHRSNRRKMPKSHEFGLPRAQAQTCWAAVQNPVTPAFIFPLETCFFIPGWHFPGEELPGRMAAHSLLTQTLHPTIFQGTRYLDSPLPSNFCAGKGQKKGTKMPISKKEHNFQ